jgi:uncharacterized protein YndB with AHSA1/START domain
MPGDRANFVLDMRRTFRAPRELVFRAFTQAEMLRHWICPAGYGIGAAHADPRVGGRFHVEMRSPEGTVYRADGFYIEMRPPELLVLTWTWAAGHTMPDVETVIRIEFSAQGEETLMVMTHSGLVSEAERAAHEEGWNGAFDKLAVLLAGR